MGSFSPQLRIAEQTSRFMVSFAKAQCLEAVLSGVGTPSNERDSTLGLLWGVALAHAEAEGLPEHVAFEAVSTILGSTAGAHDAVCWLHEHRDSESVQSWAELGAMAVYQSRRANDSMPALLDLAHQYRQDLDESSGLPHCTISVPGSQFLTRQAGHVPPMG